MEKQTVAVLGPCLGEQPFHKSQCDNGHEVRPGEISKNKSMKLPPYQSTLFQRHRYMIKLPLQLIWKAALMVWDAILCRFLQRHRLMLNKSLETLDHPVTVMHASKGY